MRIVVSGTHASGKSTLVSDFALAHTEYTVLPDPFDSLDDLADAPSARLFGLQLRISAERLHEYADMDLIAERGPLDFLAYLIALADLTGEPLDADLYERARALTATALASVDVLVILPLTASDRIDVPAEEDLALRDEMNAVLLDLLDDPELLGDRLELVEIAGTPDARRARLEGVVARGGR